MNDLVSVIIPTYNRAHLITDAINSVLNQTYENFELLLVDDHSTDNTKGVVEQYEDERIKYLVNKRTKGAQGARNTGLYAAKGEWVAMLDSDDVWYPDKLEKQLNCISKNNKLVGIGSGYNIIELQTGKKIDKKAGKKEIHTTEKLLVKNSIGGFSVFTFKRNVALKAEGFDEDFPAMQDMDFYIRLSKMGMIISVPDILVDIRVMNNFESDRISTDYKRKYKSVKLLNSKYKHLIKNKIKVKVLREQREVYYSIITGKCKGLKISNLIMLAIFRPFGILELFKAFYLNKFRDGNK